MLYSFISLQSQSLPSSKPYNPFVREVCGKRSEDKGRARWERVGALIDKEGKKSIKLDMIPLSKDWDGWLVVSERKEREEAF